MSTQPDPKKDWWDLGEVATYLGVEPDTVSGYVSRGQMPAAEERFRRSPGWRPATIIKWNEGRPGRGRRRPAE